MASSNNYVESSDNLYLYLTSTLSDNMLNNSPKRNCPICCNARNIFYCKSCVNSGNFFRSNTHAERYTEKHLRFLKFEKIKKEAQIECEKLLKPRLQKTKLLCEIDGHKERIRLLRCLIKKSQDEIAHKKAVIDQLKFDIDKSRSQTLPLYKNKVKNLQEYVVHHNNDVASQRNKLADCHDELKKLIRVSIQELVEYIFPISVMQPSRSNNVSSSFSTASALNEAATLAYMCGRWVTTDLSGQLHHTIVAPSLPASGDYSAYNDWVNATKDGVPMTNIDSLGQNQAYNISAALTFTTQLVNVIAFYLNIKLPNKLCFSEFCSTSLSESMFERRVTRLNLNVLFLCLSQNVDPDLLHPTHTLENVLHLLQAADLGRIGPMEVDPAIAWTLEDPLRNKLDSITDDSEDSDYLPEEWEKVPHNIDVPSGHPPPAQSNTGMVSSAAASIASIWRGLTR